MTREGAERNQRLGFLNAVNLKHLVSDEVCHLFIRLDANHHDQIKAPAHRINLGHPFQVGQLLGQHRRDAERQPRGDFMLIALPNPDGTFTATLFLDDVRVGIDRLVGETEDVAKGGREGAKATFFVLGWIAEQGPDLVREIVARALDDKRWVAYIDTARTLAPADWASLATTERLWIVRPPTDGTAAPPVPTASTASRTAPSESGAHGPWCADVLLRSGAFGLVVLDGSGPLTHSIAVRLTRLARESNAAMSMKEDFVAPSPWIRTTSGPSPMLATDSVASAMPYDGLTTVSGSP